MRTKTLEALLEARVRRAPRALVTDLDDGVQWLIEPDGARPEGLDASAFERARQYLTQNRSGRLDDTPTLFVQSLNPPLRVFIVGAVHIAQHLVVIAEQLGYEVLIIDPREAWASAQRFPSGTLVRRWPDEALSDYALDARSALVLLSHDPKLDDPALHIALRAAPFYIGALGSRKTHAARCQRLADAGFGAEAIGRIHAPIGLDLGGRSPAEIALATMAQLTRVLYQGEA